MEFGFEIQRRPRRTHTAAYELSRLPTEPPEKSDPNSDIPVYETNKMHAISDNENEINVKLFTVQTFASAPKKSYCRQLAWEADVLGIKYFYE